jgi:hypothetical protein
MDSLGNLDEAIGPIGRIYSFLDSSKFFDNLEA